MNLLRETMAATPLAPALEARRLARTPGMREKIEALSQRLSRPLLAMQRQAESCLREMVAVNSAPAEYLFDHGLGPAHTRAFTIEADGAALARLRQLNDRHALIFLPSHRSYADPFVMTKTLQEHGVSRTHILGGDNLRFFPFGPIARHSGGVFIRRSFKDDEVYKLVLQEYLGHLAASGSNLEWYMEGGRSRTGKLRPPKYGLLSYLVGAIRNGQAEDVILVPTSITYDQLHEVRAMLDDELSGHKPKEGLAWLAAYARMQRRWIGKVHVRFGEPMSLSQRLSQESGETRNTVAKIAFEVFQRINQATPVTAQALVTLALLSAGERALTLDEVQRHVHPLLDYAHARSLPTSQIENLRHHSGVLDTLDSLVGTGVVSRYDEGLEPVFAIEPGQHGVAAFYRNSAVHWFVNRAITELALWHTLNLDVENLEAEARRRTLALRDLLKFEFFFSEKHAFRDELLEEASLWDPGWRERSKTREQRLALLKNANFLIAHTVLPSFLGAYFIVSDRLAAHPNTRPIDRKQFLDECVTVGRQYLLQKRLLTPESISRELFTNALRLADNRKLLTPGGAELGERRRAFAKECADAVAATAALGELNRCHAITTTEEPTHGAL
ncbi:glycerol-3-phosphate acyltransferase [Solimonas sp. K1W22B-7]|uniref:1-acyl-sn-glycerol-3-phosphate acyltransferase n=1 Tax=Solimonas sp. K1W22B-7 TaxID=2303331 RepID=UPI000E3358D4|nr:1-acyl-sn-glycerol-3-phosphate acyltransferase [Solimonas sp. K1W22B-7]AXQ31084.1 glycerol-3-phosphate acyltransferase [Solimonas sp. K1W22B-7]